MTCWNSFVSMGVKPEPHSDEKSGRACYMGTEVAHLNLEQRSPVE